MVSRMVFHDAAIVGPAPDAPSDLQASRVSSSRIDLTWQDNSINESSFKIERKTGVGGTYALVGTVGAGVTSYSNTGLTASTTYCYRVRAWNPTGYSAYCAEASATTLPPPPPKPTLVSRLVVRSSPVSPRDCNGMLQLEPQTTESRCRRPPPLLSFWSTRRA